MPEVRYIGLAALQAKAIAAVTEAVTQAAEDLTGKAQEASPVDTGTLRASIHVEGVKSDERGAEATVATGGEANDYAIYQHEGTSRGVPATKFLEKPLLDNAALYKEYIAAAARSEF